MEIKKKNKQWAASSVVRQELFMQQAFLTTSSPLKCPFKTHSLTIEGLLGHHRFGYKGSLWERGGKSVENSM